MSVAQALEILGINAGATEQDIRAAYNRLMKRVHPDVGGSAYFSKQLNAARDVLLRQLRAHV
jgi:curved DNA-binding protein CbpA